MEIVIFGSIGLFIACMLFIVFCMVMVTRNLNRAQKISEARARRHE